MRWEKVRLAGLAHHLPERRVTSEELEGRLAPLYERLGLRVGRLELMTGIRERRAFPPGTRPSEVAAAAGRRALEAARLPPERIGLLVHGAVCRDFLEPSTASVVHHRLELPPTCEAFDLSNACLGVLDGMAVAADKIEAGALDAALIVTGEDGGPLVERTLASLLGANTSRRELKAAFASLTIGAGAAAVVVARDELAPEAPRLLGGVARAATHHHELCSGDHAEDGAGPLMETDSEALLNAGCALAAETFDVFLSELGWSPQEIDRVVTHQVGVAHRRALLAAIGISPERDHPTVEWLGNMGSAALPATLSLAAAEGRLEPGNRVALLGIGSGLFCRMLGLSF
jgi:3-oxoacyl-[acyl-carrier-protein] synthase-3